MDLVEIISQVGFPIAVATFVLVKLDKTMSKVLEVLVKVADRLEVNEEVA